MFLVRRPDGVIAESTSAPIQRARPDHREQSERGRSAFDGSRGAGMTLVINGLEAT